MNVLDLFSGIGGFSLGLERAGMRTVAFCEIDPYCRAVLAKHWPDVPVFGDARELTATRLAADAYRWRQPQFAQCNGQSQTRQQSSQRDNVERLDIDVICGGFPCQDISVAGKGAGIGGERSGLWSEYARIIGEVRPRYVVVENVAALLGRGLERVLGDLAALGFDAEWHCIPASAVGAPHRRDRVWIVGNAQRIAQSGKEHAGQNSVQQRAIADGTGADVAHAGGERLEIAGNVDSASRQEANGCTGIPDADSKPARRLAISWGECGQWLVEPDVGRVADGVPARVDRLRALGNAIVPQIAEIIGRAIMMAEREEYDLVFDPKIEATIFVEYDADDDFAKSLLEAYRVIRERMARGGPGWTPKP